MRKIGVIIISFIVLFVACSKTEKKEEERRSFNIYESKGSKELKENSKYFIGDNLSLKIDKTFDVQKELILTLGKIGVNTTGLSFNVVKDKSFASLLEVELFSKDKEDNIMQLILSQLPNRLGEYYYKGNLKGKEVYLKLKGNGIVSISQAVCSPSFKDNDKPKHVFMISVDTLRADHLQSYGYKIKNSKFLNEFTNDSVIFNNCFSTSSWTLPAHISLFTGKGVFEHGILTKYQVLKKESTSLAQFLGKDFYLKSFNGGLFVSPKYGFYKGFDLYQCLPYPADSYKLFFKVLDYLDGSPKRNNFFFLHTYQVHSPYSAHKDHDISEEIFNETLKKSYALPNDLGGKNFIYKEISPEVRENIVKLYDAEIEYFDKSFGNFIKELKKRKIYDNSMILIFSDHGEEFYDHMGWEHGHTLYNELIHIPLMIKFPKSEFKGKKIDAYVSICDIMPTILDYYGVKGKGKGTNTLSLYKLLKGGKKINRELLAGIHFEHNKNKKNVLPQKFAIINEGFKYIYNFPFTDDMKKFYTPMPQKICESEFYNLKEDGKEKNNIIDSKENQRLVLKLRKRLLEIQKKIKLIKKGSKNIQINEKEKKKQKTLGYL